MNNTWTMALSVAVVVVKLSVVGVILATVGAPGHGARADVGPAASVPALDMARTDREWRDAYGAAQRSGGWTELIAVGDSAVAIDEAAGRQTTFRAEARRTYLEALFRARAQRSAEGIVRAADAFERLGDQEAAALARRMLSNPA